jgi:hypothetical protein
MVAASSLMLMYYGEDAMAKSSDSAAASTLINAGSNIEFASTAYRITSGRLPETIDDLKRTVNDYQWLLEDPKVGTATRQIPAIADVGEDRIYYVGGLTIDVCIKVNKNYERLGLIPETMDDLKRGCVQNGRNFIYFVKLGKVGGAKENEAVNQSADIDVTKET